MRRLVVVLALVASVLSQAPPVVGQPSAVRRAGPDRYATAVEISKATAPAGADLVYVASGTSPTDALAVTPVAGAQAAPALLVAPTSLPSVVATELDRLDPERIVVLGGRSAVSDSVVSELRDHAPTVDRLSGADRYATAAAVSASHYPPGVVIAYVTSGTSTPDALAAGAPAVGKGPVLLVTRDGIPAPTAAELHRLEPGNIVIVGGTAAVSDDVRERLGIYTAGSVSRRSGPNRFATSAVASLGEFDPSTTDVYLASGRTTADALAGGWAAGVDRGPVLLTERTCVPDRVLQEIDRLDPDRLVLLGGTAVLADSVGALTPCRTQAEVIATGLDVPWDVAFVPGGRAYVTERRRGRVLLREPDGSMREVHRLPSDDAGEGGLLGLAASPDFASDGLLYAYFTTASDNRLVRFRPGGSVTTLLSAIPRAANHDGGRIAFGPDGKLYVTTGDAGVGSRSQDDGLAGKILRVNPDGSVPADNPRPGSYVYAKGLRNPQGLAWDASGRFYATEIGPTRDDEVNVIVPNGNYGWPAVTGVAGDPRFIDPVAVRQPAVASWSGAAIVRGGIPEWDGDLLVAALRGTRLYKFDLSSTGTIAGVSELYTGQYGRLRHVEQAPDGSVWILTSNRDGRGSPVPGDDRIIRVGPPA